MNHNRSILLLIILLQISNGLFCREKIDSLLATLTNAKGKQEINLLNAIAEEYSGVNNSKKCFEYAEKALNKARAIKYIKGESDALNNLGSYYQQKNDYKKAFVYFENSLRLKEQIKDRSGMALTYNNLGILYRKQNDFDKAIQYFQLASKYSIETNNLKVMAKSYNNIGSWHDTRGEYDKAIEFISKAIDIYKKIDEKKGLGVAFYNLGNAYNRTNNYEKAIKSYQEAQKIFETIDYKKGIAGCLNSTGLVYESIGQNDTVFYYYNKAIEYYNKAIAIAEEINEYKIVGDSYSNIGVVLCKIGEAIKSKNLNLKADKYFTESIEAHSKALKYRQKINDKQGISSSYTNIGATYGHIKDYEKALEYYIQSLNIISELNIPYEQAVIYYYISEANFYLRQYEQALKYLDKSIVIFKEIKIESLVNQCNSLYFRIYAAKKEWEKAYNYSRKYDTIYERIFNEKNQKLLTDMQTKYETEKKEEQIKNLNKQQELQKKVIQQQKYLLYFFIFIFVIIVGFSFALFRQFRIIRKANIKLNEQNETISKQKEEITDSIKYARRIQRAILPPEEYAKNLLPEHFILFRPRDIVSGDFYWLRTKNNKIITAAADCTGHGVPGAFMSMLGVAFLNEILTKMDEIHAAEILNQLRQNVINSLHQTGKIGEAQDGMDIALCVIDPEKRILEYAGANNSLYHIRNGELNEVKADKMPIGIYIKKDELFKDNIIQLERGDMLYTFSDGFADQFGGPEGKKFKSKNMKELLKNISSKPVKEQHDILNTTIENWITEGNTHQTDDIIVLGVRIT